MCRINYAKIDLILKFEQPIIIKKPLIFTFRSVLGKELKRISCIFKDRSCEECSINSTCPYSFYFESPQFELGNKKPHPFTLYANFEINKEIESAKLSITLIGNKAIENFPYLYFSLLKAGEKGIFRDRIKFNIADVKKENSSILISKDRLNMNFKYDFWELNEDKNNLEKRKLEIKFLTPVRIKKNGKILINLDYITILNSIFRRIKFLSMFYGEKPINVQFNINDFSEIIFEKGNFKKVSFNYYSSRQKRKILLIGSKGELIIEKKFSPIEISLLNGIKIFSIGSNTTFGFGLLDYIEN